MLEQLYEIGPWHGSHRGRRLFCPGLGLGGLQKFPKSYHTQSDKTKLVAPSIDTAAMTRSAQQLHARIGVQITCTKKFKPKPKLWCKKCLYIPNQRNLDTNGHCSWANPSAWFWWIQNGKDQVVTPHQSVYKISGNILRFTNLCLLRKHNFLSNT